MPESTLHLRTQQNANIATYVYYTFSNVQNLIATIILASLHSNICSYNLTSR